MQLLLAVSRKHKALRVLEEKTKEITLVTKMKQVFLSSGYVLAFSLWHGDTFERVESIRMRTSFPLTRNLESQCFPGSKLTSDLTQSGRIVNRRETM